VHIDPQMICLRKKTVLEKKKVDPKKSADIILREGGREVKTEALQTMYP